MAMKVPMRLSTCAQGRRGGTESHQPAVSCRKHHGLEAHSDEGFTRAAPPTAARQGWPAGWSRQQPAHACQMETFHVSGWCALACRGSCASERLPLASWAAAACSAGSGSYFQMAELKVSVGAVRSLLQVGPGLGQRGRQGSTNHFY
jgi:hypothetical protein